MAGLRTGPGGPMVGTATYWYGGSRHVRQRTDVVVAPHDNGDMHWLVCARALLVEGAMAGLRTCPPGVRVGEGNLMVGGLADAGTAIMLVSSAR